MALIMRAAYAASSPFAKPVKARGKPLDRGFITFKVQGQSRIGRRNQHLELNHDVTRINTIIDPMPRDGIFWSPAPAAPKTSRAFPHIVATDRRVIESTLTHLPKHVWWQYERIGNGENPIYRFGLQKDESSSTLPYTRDLGASRPLCEYDVAGQGRTNDVAHLNCQLSAADKRAYHFQQRHWRRSIALQDPCPDRMVGGALPRVGEVRYVILAS
ncbi:hypothetical protein ACOJBO_11915 [Rhizobium beringeri]